MPWVKKIKVDQHECKKPELFTSVSIRSRYERGSQWRCRSCKQLWEVDWRASSGFGWVEVAPDGR